MELDNLLLSCAAVIIVTLVFYVAASIANRDWSTNVYYVMRLVVVAAIAVFVIPAFRSVGAEFGLGDLGLLLSFVVLIIAVRFLVVDELTVSDDWLSSMGISLIGVVMIYILNEVFVHLLDIRLLAII
jgi:hypothetical protein